MPTITNKLYPPTIGNRIPAFQQDYYNNLFVTVPFQNNRSVARADIITIALKLKTITNDFRTINGYAYVEEGQSLEDAIYNAWKKGVVTFKITPDQQQTEDGWFLNIGQFYKIQLAYVATFTPEGEEPTPEEYAQHVGYYSQVGISKFSWYPTVYIDGLSEINSNTHTYEYFGRQSQTYNLEEGGVTETGIADSTEKVYNQKFIITNTLDGEDPTVVKDSGWLLHDSSTDECEQESYDHWEYLNELPTMGMNKIQQLVQTNSGIEAASEEYQLVNNINSGSFVAEGTKGRYDFDNGYVELTGVLQSGWPYHDTYWLRTDLETGERVKIGKIHYPENSTEVLEPYIEIFKDFTVEQGKTYQYQVISKIGVSPDLIDVNFSYQVKIDFEDIFLYDGARQLKVRFNPSMSGIHKTIMESKTETIGSKFPFFFRNGDVGYYDFTIGGLVSFHMDEQRLFSIYGLEEQPGRDRTYTPMSFSETESIEDTDLSLSTDLTGKNFTHERKFRQEVFDWLSNGELKLFRSSSEGMRLVRLMGVSMSPDQTTSRMIYSFSCQAYEADEHDYESLVKHGIIKLS